MAALPPNKGLDLFQRILAVLIVLAWAALSYLDAVSEGFDVPWPAQIIVGIVVAAIYPDGAAALAKLLPGVFRKNGNGNGGK